MPSHRAEVGCGWRAGCLVPLVWSLVHCSRWLRLEEAGAIGEDSMPWHTATCSSLGLLSFMSSSVSSTFVAITTHTFQRFLGL